MARLPSISALLLALFLTTGGAGSAWAKGDIERGKRLARECFACHGQDGYSPSPINPKIGGQHERYLFLSLKEYRDGGRTHSLMRGSVLNKTDQDLEDIAAYYAGQPGYLTPREIWERTQEGAPATTGPPAGAQQGGPPRGPAGPPKFDHSDHIARYNSMLAQAIRDAAQAPGQVGDAACAGLSGSADSDRDGDGLADAYDAAPDDAG
ncbi:MAG: cytochrome c, partial [Gammaproteobacteria bacterium]|nr:cytochrome c [Gammaproteobacteria bacterium]